MKLIFQSYAMAWLLILLHPVPAGAQNTPLTGAIQKHELETLFPSAAMIDKGKTVAEASCSACHGLEGAGVDETIPNLAGQRSVYMYRVLKGYQRGQRTSEIKQRTVRFLNDEAMLAVAAYYASRPPVSNYQLPSASITAEELDDGLFTGIRDALGKCNKCHGETGNSTASGMPNLTAQAPEYFVNSMLAYVDGSRSHRLMERLVGALDNTTIREMGVYYAVQEPVRSDTAGEGDVAAGAELAVACESCHGPGGNADGEKMPSLAGQDARYFVKAMDAYKEGKRQHKSMFDAVEALSDADISNLATYYAAQEPVRRNVRMPLKTTEWITRCQRCHGVDGNSGDPRFPMLAGQNESYLRNVMHAYSDDSRPGTVMHAMSAPLSNTDIERMASYYASQTPRPAIYIQLPCEDSMGD